MLDVREEKGLSYLIYPCPVHTGAREGCVLSLALSSAKAGGSINTEITNAGTFDVLSACENQIWWLFFFVC